MRALSGCLVGSYRTAVSAETFSVFGALAVGSQEHLS
jgi:hypothetical protein